MNKTTKELISGSVYDEDFAIAFYALLEKFVNEYDDMSQMNVIQQASELLDTINNQ
jgi:hypothetical protein